MLDHEINKTAVLSKVNRTLKSMKGKRGASKDAYLEEIFIIPVQTPSGKTSSEDHIKSELLKEAFQEVESAHIQLEDSRTKLQERRESVCKVRETTKQLKRKLDRKETSLEAKKVKLESLEKSKKTLLGQN